MAWISFFALADALVEALAGLLAEPSALDHLLLKSAAQEALAPRIVRHGVDTDSSPTYAHTSSPTISSRRKLALFGKPDQRTGERVHFFDGVIAFAP